MDSLKFCLSHTRDMGKPYASALIEEGYQEVSTSFEADFVILDHNWKDGYRDSLPTIQYCRENNKPVFMIPHGTRGWMFWDNCYEVDNDVTAYFVPAIGHKMVMKAGDSPIPMFITGFPWCKTKSWQPCELQKILFAPIHPEISGDYIYSRMWRDYNKEAWRRLIPLMDIFNITVYFNGDLLKNGLTEEPGVRYVQSDLSIEKALYEIDSADLIIAQETFASLALARGKTVFMFDDSTLPPTAHGKESRYWLYYAQNWIYPLSFLAPAQEELFSLMKTAAKHESAAVAQWKNHFIGDNFNPHGFVATIRALTRRTYEHS